MSAEKPNIKSMKALLREKAVVRARIQTEEKQLSESVRRAPSEFIFSTISIVVGRLKANAPSALTKGGLVVIESLFEDKSRNNNQQSQSEPGFGGGDFLKSTVMKFISQLTGGFLQQ